MLVLKLNPGTLEEQPVLFTTESSINPYKGPLYAEIIWKMIESLGTSQN